MFSDAILPLDFRAVSALYQPYRMPKACGFLMQSCQEVDLIWNQEPGNQGGQRKVSLLFKVRLKSKSHIMKVSKLVCQCDGLGDAVPWSCFADGHVVPATGTACSSQPLQGLPLCRASMSKVKPCLGHPHPVADGIRSTKAKPSGPMWDISGSSFCCRARCGVGRGCHWGCFTAQLLCPILFPFPALCGAVDPKGTFWQISCLLNCLRICFQENLIYSTQTFGLPLAVGLVGI